MAVEARALPRPLYARSENGRYTAGLLRALDRRPNAFVASTSGNRLAAAEHHLTTIEGFPNIIVLPVHTGEEDESQLPSQIAANKTRRARAIIAELIPPNVDHFVIAADVKVTPLGQTSVSKLANEEMIKDLFRSTAEAAKKINDKPNYQVIAASDGYARRGRTDIPYNRMETAMVILNPQRFEEIATLEEEFIRYKRSVEYADIPAKGSAKTKLTKISGGFSLPGLVHAGAVDELFVGEKSYPRYINGANGNLVDNPEFKDAFKVVFYLQAVGFSSKMMDEIVHNYPYLAYDCAEAAEKLWGWIDKVTALTFNEPLPIDLPLNTHRRKGRKN